MSSFHKQIKPFLLAALVLGGISAHAQQLLSFDGGNTDNARSVTSDQAGNVFVGGSSRSSKPVEFVVLKHGANGNLQWVARPSLGQGFLGGAANDVVTDSAGNVYAVGFVLRQLTPLAVAADWAVVSFNSQGNQRWAHFIPGAQAITASIDASGLYVSGSQGAATGRNWLVTKYSLSGSVLWQRTEGLGTTDRVVDTELDKQGNLLVLGTVPVEGGNPQSDAKVVKFDPSGNVAFRGTYTFSGISDEEPSDLAVDPDGSAYITGISFTSGFVDGPAEAFLTKFSVTGETGFAKTGVGGLFVAADGTGVVASGGQSLSKFSLAGDPLWSTFVASGGRIGLDSESSVLMASSVSAPGGSAYFVQKFSATGVGLLEIIEPAGDGITDVHVAQNGDFLVTGNVGSFRPDILTARFPRALANPVIPAAPTGLTLQSAKGRLTLRWTDNADNESGYRIERSINGGAFVTIGTVEPDLPQFTDTGLSKRLTYSYRVVAFNGAGESGFSNTATGSPK